MNAKVFLDSNIVVYAQSDDGYKTEVAMELLNSHPVISIQVINESFNVFTKKKILSVEQARYFARLWLETTDVEPLTVETVNKAFELSEQYYFSHWDALIVAAALLANCTILYSEDMQHDLKIENSLTIVNPFLDKGL